MSTPEQDLLRYEQEQDRLDRLEAKFEREADEHEEHSCDYCGTDETTAWHVITGGAEQLVYIGGRECWQDCDVYACGECFAELESEK